MLTRPINDTRCLMLLLYVVLERILDSEIQTLARSYRTTTRFVGNIRARSQRDDMPGVLLGAPRIGCIPPQRFRFNAPDPNCFERTGDYLTIAEILDPDTPRTAATIRIGGQSHTFPVEHTNDGPVPIILDPLDRPEVGIPANLTFAAVARMLGYGPGQPAPTSEPLAWAEEVAAREGVQPRNSSDLLALVERYADVYPGGRQGLSDLAGQLLRPVAEAGKKVAKAGKKVAEEAAEVAKEGAKAYKKYPKIGQVLRGALVGYGGPFAVLAIDVVENRLNKRGYTLGSVAESRDADVFAIR